MKEKLSRSQAVARKSEQLDAHTRALIDRLPPDSLLFRRLVCACMQHRLAPEIFHETQQGLLMHTLADRADEREKKRHETIQRILRERHCAIVARVLSVIDALFQCSPSSRNTRILRWNISALQRSMQNRRRPSSPRRVAMSIELLRTMFRDANAPPTPSPKPSSFHGE